MVNTKLMLKKGFTLIELLIVIAVLGILAVAVLAAINPIEQINRSRDTGSRSDSEQLISAIDRFYASSGYYPWKVSSTNPKTDATTWDVVDNSTWTDGATTVLDKLAEEGTGELKSSFTNRIVAPKYNTLYKYNSGDPGSSTYICFLAKSASFQTEAGTRCDPTLLTLPSDFPADACAESCAAAKSCYSCLP
jgi:prepilin-type N-terminal cleavage/methylation domain-containing protein